MVAVIFRLYRSPIEEELCITLKENTYNLKLKKSWVFFFNLKIVNGLKSISKFFRYICTDPETRYYTLKAYEIKSVRLSYRICRSDGG